MKEETRKMARVFHCEAEDAGGDGIRLRFYGRTQKSGRSLRFVVLFPWDYLPYLVPKIQRHWADERARRILKLHEVDNALPKPQ